MRWLFAVCFIANLLAVVVVLSVDGAKSSPAADNKTPVPAKKDNNKISEAIESLGKRLEKKLEQFITAHNSNFKQLISAVVNATCQEKPEEPDVTFASCRDIYLNHKSEGNKAYTLQKDTGKFPVYCHMTSTSLGACGGGGWTLAMKIDGTKRTFHYDSKFWSNKNEFNLPGGRTGFDTQETKLPTYWNTPFSKICLGMKYGNYDQLNFIVINQHANSLYSLIADGAYRQTSVGRNTWKTLIGAQASLQRYCNKEGFNAVGDGSSADTQSKARIGFIANQENECGSCDSRIGFGTGGLHDDSNTCGNEASYSPDNGVKHIKAMGYILVQ